jgi:hypothetical protein
MTFSELVTLVRREVIVDQYEDAFSDAAILDALWRASLEVAAAFDFPRRVTTVSVPAGADSVSLPPRVRRVHTLTIDGDDLRSVDLQQLSRALPGANRPSRYYNFDPRRADALRISPPSPGGSALLEYTVGLVRPVNLEDAEPWDGLLPEFHSLIAYRAGVALYQMEERQEESAFWANEYQTRATELAGVLGRSDMGSLMLPPEVRNDAGAAG